MAGKSKKEKWASHDGACTSCRARKIRCGREKPQCSCCRRDQIECVYSSPPKRVNHMKMLCQSFDDMQDRLIMMQGDLSWLTTTLNKSDVHRRPELTSAEVPSSPYTGETAATPLTAGHVVRDDGTQTERYYGPWTLVALCHDFETDLASHLSGPNDMPVRSLARQMLVDSTRTEDNILDLWIKPDEPDVAIHLPPRQLLSAMLKSFLKQADYNTDIFCHQTVYEAVERVYKEPSSPTSEPWALCFNLIILLILGAEQPLHREDPFVRPILEAAYATARKPSFSKSPRLVNVQALALFSLLAQQQHTMSETLGGSIFAQACILAREAGLHQCGNDLASSSNISVIDAEERRKVFKSLFIRDRYSATACGAFTWLPRGGPKGPPPTPTSAVHVHGARPSDEIEIQLAPHWELAKIQDEFHHLLGLADASEISPSEWRTVFTRLQQKLERWIQTHKIPSSTRPSTVDGISLHLAFLGIRIRLLSLDINTGDTVQQVSAQTLHDARLSCLLVATSCSHYPNQTLTARLDHLLEKSELTSSRGAQTHSSSSNSSPTSESSPSSPIFYSTTDAPQRTGSMTPPLMDQNSAEVQATVPLPFHRLANVFPTAAVFVIARHILSLGPCAQTSQSPSHLAHHDAQTQHEMIQDKWLLEALLLCFRSTQLPTTIAAAAHRKVDSEAYPSKFGRIIQHLISIIHAITDPASRSDTDDPSRHAEADEVYAPEPQLASTYSLPPSLSSYAVDMPDMSLYTSSSGSDGVSSSHDDMPSAISTSSSSLAPSTWVAPQDEMPSSTTPLLTRGSSIYTPSPRTTIPDPYFDISQFLNQMDTSDPTVWGDGQGAQTDMPTPQRQKQQEPYATRQRSGKRQRTTDT